MDGKSKHFFGKEELSAIEELFKSGNTYRYKKDGGECDKFEEEFSKKFKFEKSIQITSGTNAIVAGLMVLGVSRGDEVIIPAYTYIATAAAILSLGAIPVVVNIDESLTISLKEIKNSISDRTKAIIPVHMDGYQCNIEAIVKLAKDNDLFVIEDVAQAMGAKFNGKYLGTFGDIGCFSLNKDKILSCGEGGIVATTRRDLVTKLLSACDHGYNFNPLHKDIVPSEEMFLGHSMRVSDISGAIMRVQLMKLDNFLIEYRLRKDEYSKAIEKEKLTKTKLIKALDESGESCTSLMLKCSNGKAALEISKKLVDQGIIAIPVDLKKAHTVWRWGDLIDKKCSHSDRSNPFLITDKKYSYSKIFFLESIEILSSVLKIEIDITKSTEVTSKDVAKLVNILKEQEALL